VRTIPIGLLFSATGPYGVVGRSMLNGALLAIETLEAAGSGVRLQPVIADPGGELSRYPALCSELLDAGIRHIVGCYTSSSRKELIPVVEKRDALLWYPSHYEGFESSSNVVYTGAAPNQHIIPLIGYALAQRDRRVFCIGSNYIWAWENNRILREILLARGGSVLAERYFQVGEQDFSQAIAAILALRPDFIFNTLIGSSAYRFFGAFRAACAAQGIDQARDMPLLSCSLSEPELAEIAPDARCGHISSSVYFSSIDSDENRRFVAAYDRRFPAGPVVSADAEASYVAVRLLALALQEAGTDAIGPVASAAGRQVLQAPQGKVCLDAQTMHAFLTPRIGRSRADGGFDILHQAVSPVQPDPYLVRSMPCLESVAAPRLKVVS
jgi:ABC-type branched-subunit amino acid transport system substrate-binding protein